ncbi:LytTR family transcriptional regulator [Paenibacillaceae bacterium]|nr:LytTR family transcriptional regulator [Paenibacillaceae bacterium]
MMKSKLQVPVVTLQGTPDVLRLDQDVVYLQSNGRGSLSFHSYDQEFKAVQRIEEWSNVLLQRGFLRVDRGTIVNLHRIIALDRKLKVIYVETKQGVHAIPVTAANMNHIFK